MESVIPKDEEKNTTDENQKGVSSVVFTIVICTIILLVVACTIYINLMDKLNAIEAYKYSEQRRRAEEYRVICEENYGSIDLVTEWIRQQNLKPPAEFLKKRLCIVSSEIENEKH